MKCSCLNIFVMMSCISIPSLLSAQMNWTCATDSAEWLRRDGHTSVVFDNKMWVITYDVLYSTGLGIEENNTAIVKDRYLKSTLFNDALRLPSGSSCRVFDITGRVVEPTKIQPGIYFIEVDNRIIQKVIKIK